MKIWIIATSNFNNLMILCSLGAEQNELSIVFLVCIIKIGISSSFGGVSGLYLRCRGAAAAVYLVRVTAVDACCCLANARDNLSSGVVVVISWKKYLAYTFYAM